MSQAKSALVFLFPNKTAPAWKATIAHLHHLAEREPAPLRLWLPSTQGRFIHCQVLQLIKQSASFTAESNIFSAFANAPHSGIIYSTRNCRLATATAQLNRPVTLGVERPDARISSSVTTSSSRMSLQLLASPGDDVRVSQAGLWL